MGMEEHDIVVIGASAGGVDPLKEVDTSLSSDLRVRFFVVFHFQPFRPERKSDRNWRMPWKRLVTRWIKSARPNGFDDVQQEVMKEVSLTLLVPDDLAPQ